MATAEQLVQDQSRDADECILAILNGEGDARYTDFFSAVICARLADATRYAAAIPSTLTNSGPNARLTEAARDRTVRELCTDAAYWLSDAGVTVTPGDLYRAVLHVAQRHCRD